MKDKISIFVERLKKLGIEVNLIVNYPWVYINKINGKYVTEKFESDHAFTLAFLPIRQGQEIQFTDISKIFKLIRKYSYTQFTDFKIFRLIRKYI